MMQTRDLTNETVVMNLDLQTQTNPPPNRVLMILIEIEKKTLKCRSSAEDAGEIPENIETTVLRDIEIGPERAGNPVLSETDGVRPVNTRIGGRRSEVGRIRNGKAVRNRNGKIWT